MSLRLLSCSFLSSGAFHDVSPGRTATIRHWSASADMIILGLAFHPRSGQFAFIWVFKNPLKNAIGIQQMPQAHSFQRYKYFYCRRNLVCTFPTIYLCRLVLLNLVLRIQTQTRGQQQWRATLVDRSPLLSTVRACQTHSWSRYQGGRRHYQRTWHFMSQAYTIVLRQ